MIRTRTLAWLGIVVLTLSQSACVDIENPIFDPAKTEVDQKLVGQWLSPDPKEKSKIVVAAAKNLKGAPAGLMSLDDTSGQGGKDEKIYAFGGKVGNETYLHLAIMKKNANEWTKNNIEAHWLMKYAVDGDRWTLWLMDPDATAKVIEGGKLKGLVKKGGFGKEVKVQDTAENLRKFLSDGGHATVFHDKGKLTLERVK